MATIRCAVLSFLVLLGSIPGGLNAIDEWGSTEFWEEQAIVASACTGGEVNPVIDNEVFTANDNIECIAAGSITIGPSVVFEDGSQALLGAPRIRVLENVEIQSGGALAIGSVLTAQVPKTGQVTCYDANGLIEACAGSGQDGELREGVAWPAPRFTVQGDGTVKDNLTGLVWMANPECLDRFAFPNTTWVDAIEAANMMADGQCGLSDGSSVGDWRIPNIRELITLFHYGYNDLALPDTAGSGQWQEGKPFSNVKLGSYWTGTTHSGDSDLAWAMVPRYGEPVRYPKTTSEYIWPVRDGP